MRNKNKHFAILRIFVWIFFICVLLFPFFLIFQRYSEIEYEKEHQYHEFVSEAEKNSQSTNSTTNDAANITKIDEKKLPEKILIEVPFTTQAPSANWDAVHEESCEEASILMLNHFLNKTSFGSASDVDREILNLIDFEEKNNYKVDVTTDELNRIAKDFFDLDTGRVVNNFTVNDLKKELASGRPIIIPAAGKLLKNPNFKGGGPVYHMLVIKGYDQDNFITNDPGTRNGNGYKYNIDLLFDAIHNWDKDNIINGNKSYLVFD